MPHQCVHCGTLYEDTAQEILTGCSVCGSKLFFYVKEDRIKELRELQQKLSDEEIKKIEKDVLDLIGEEADKDKPVILDLETIRINKEGEYLIDLVHLFKGESLIYKISEGKYYIDLAKTFENFNKKKDEKD